MIVLKELKSKLILLRTFVLLKGKNVNEKINYRFR